MSKELLAQVKEERGKLNGALAGVNPLHQDRAVGEEGWSVKDILGLLASWEELVARGVDQAVRGQEVEALKYFADDKRRQFFQDQVKAKRGLPEKRIKEEFETAWENLFEVLLDLSPAMWQKPAVAQLVQSVGDTYRNQREKIEAWKEQGMK